MAKISSCFKWTFVFFNSLFAIFGVLIIALGLYTQQYAKEVPLKKATDLERKVNFRTGVIALYVIGSFVFCFSVLGAYGAHKESKCELIVVST
ncbi:tetraspanin-8-like [Clarias gariepinus]|uniref:tetraspanin-8-like n=1 Tax=Clarias gariepinus TaxID=13013 RepID=UPI00234D239D|nr:tetraspanin-8-like [Clarias gariepinus]